jgi:NADH-quinone oxidoreductase subunit H
MMTTLADLLPAWSFGNIWLLILIKFVIAATLFLACISVGVMFAIWWERKISGHIQSRLGPMHTGMWHGWAQSLADGIKLIQKEDLIPGDADGFMFRLAPYMAFAPVFAAFVAMPFGPQLTFDGSLNSALLLILAVLSVEVMSVILAGWGSNNKWAIYGAMREACQMVSYEVPLGIALICGIMAAGTLNLVELGYLQGAGIWDWYAFHNPFLTGAFAIYFVASLASCKRAPFDLPEAESELVAGYHTEYSGLRWSFFFFAEYAGMFIVGGILAFLYLGGWNSPLGRFDPVYALIGYDPIDAGRSYATGATGAAVGWIATAEQLRLTPAGLVILNLYSLGWVVLKGFGLIFTQMWIRWTLPRIRIDQVLYVCVKVLLPASLITLVGTAVWLWLVEQPTLAAVDAELMPHWAHLLGPSTPWLQSLTQIVLTALAVAVVLACAGIVLVAWINRDKQTRKTLFPDVMPVGRDVNFTRGK